MIAKRIMNQQSNRLIKKQQQQYRRLLSSSASSSSSSLLKLWNRPQEETTVTTAVAAAAAAATCRFYTTNNNDRTTSCDSNNDHNNSNTDINSNTNHGTTFPIVGKSIPTRKEQLRKLQTHYNTPPTRRTATHNDVLDVLIIGGGATGCGAALDASMRGLNVALIEKGDFGTETSSKSTKLIWAGIKYIATAISSLLRIHNLIRPVAAITDFQSELHMVLGAHKERRILLENNPHLTNWVPIAIPFDRWISNPPPFGHPIFGLAPVVMPLVMKVYDGMGNFCSPPSHIMTKARALRKFPQLTNNIKYFQIFYEGQHNDARTNTCIALTAAEEGATVVNYVEMTKIIRLADKEPYSKTPKKAIGVMCRDTRDPTSKEFPVYAKSIIFCGGPFTDSMREMEPHDSEDKQKYKPAVAAGGGTHIVLPSYYCPGGIGMLDINTSDGRFLFFLPWEGTTLVGTTDRKGDPATSYPGPPEEEIQWLLEETSKYIASDITVRRSDVLSAWQGYRPLVSSDPHASSSDGNGDGESVSRDHIISTNPDTGITFITGGKWTTYREMAEDVITKVIKLHNLKPSTTNKGTTTTTENRPLRGGVGYTRNLPITLVQEFGISEDSANHLCRTYGMNALDVCRMVKPTTTTASKSISKWKLIQKWNSTKEQQSSWSPSIHGKVLVTGFPYLECEIPYICRNEMVCSVKDVLTLRTRLAYLNKEAALYAAPKIADLMSKELGWSKIETKKQLEEALEELSKFGGSVPNDPSYSDDNNKTTADNNKLTNQFKFTTESVKDGSPGNGGGILG